MPIRAFDTLSVSDNAGPASSRVAVAEMKKPKIIRRNDFLFTCSPLTVGLAVGRRTAAWLTLGNHPTMGREPQTTARNRTVEVRKTRFTQNKPLIMHRVA